MCRSDNKILTECFDKEELTDKKRPETVRTSLLCFAFFFFGLHINGPLVFKQTSRQFRWPISTPLCMASDAVMLGESLPGPRRPTAQRMP